MNSFEDYKQGYADGSAAVLKNMGLFVESMKDTIVKTYGQSSEERKGEKP